MNNKAKNSKSKNAVGQQKQSAAPEDRLTVTLSAETTALVRWYCDTTKHQDNVTVDGALHGALARAKEDYEKDSMCEGFNHVLGDVLECMDTDRLEDFGEVLRQPVAKAKEPAVEAKESAAAASRTVTLEFSPDAYVMLQFLATYDDHATVEECIRHDLASGVVSLCESLSRSDQEEHLQRIFGIEPKEAEAPAMVSLIGEANCQR